MQTLIVVLERLDGRFCIFPSVMGTIWAMEEEEEGEKEKEEEKEEKEEKEKEKEEEERGEEKEEEEEKEKEKTVAEDLKAEKLLVVCFAIWRTTTPLWSG